MARFSPIYTGVWNDARLEGLPFEAKAFFVYTCSNERIRPSGIYRVTDSQLSADTGLPARRVCQYLELLVARRRIVRDGAWMFVRGYLRRQPKQEFLLKGAEADVMACTSPAVLTAFGEKYPFYRQWSADRLATIGQWGNDSHSAFALALALPDALALAGDGRPTDPATLAEAEGSRRSGTRAEAIAFEIPASVQAALARAPILGAVRRLQQPAWWQAQVRAHGRRGIDFAAEVLKAEAWLTTNPKRAPKHDHARFLHNWLGRAEGPHDA